MSAEAADYWLVNRGSSSSPAEFSDVSNWRLGSADGDEVSTPPGDADSIRWATGYSEAWIALDGDYTIQAFTQRFNVPHLCKSPNASSDTVTFTITKSIGDGGYQYFNIYDGVKFVVPSTTDLGCSWWDGGASQLNVYNGATAEIYAKIASRHMRYSIASGGSMIFAPASYSASNFGGAYDSFAVANGAELSFPSGLNVVGGNNSTQQINQNGGTVTFGGGFASKSPWTYTWNAGTLAVTADSEFAANIALVVPASKSVTLDVADGATFSVPGLSADPTATITKTGGGTFSIAPTTAPIVIQEGVLGLATAGTYDLSNVSLGGGASAEINLTALGARIDSLPEALADVKFTADLSSATAGTVVFYSASADVLAKVKGDLTAPSGFELVASGEALTLEVVSDYYFGTSGNILDNAGWNTASALTDANIDVSVTGEGVVAEYSGGELPAWNSIEVKDGATLKISADCELPSIILNKDATLEISGGTAKLVNGLTCVVIVGGDGDVTLPVLTVASGATLAVASDMKFKNVDFRLYGTITKAGGNSEIGPTFGYAASGETAYFAMTVDGGKLDIHSATDTYPERGKMYFLCPESGGKVIPVGTITLKDTERKVNGWNDFGNIVFGLDNPTSIPFDVVLDNVKLNAPTYIRIAGAAHLSLRNGSFIERPASCGGHWYPGYIQDAATVTIEDEKSRFAWTSGASSFGVNSALAVDSVTVKNGGVYAPTYANGTGKGVFVSDGGVTGATQLYAANREHSALLNGFGSVRLDGDLTIASLKDVSSGHVQWERRVTLANIPFGGEGDVTVTNGVPAYPFTVTVRNGSNTATGSIKVAKVEGDAETALYFADGANWAGTVVAGNVALTNLTDGVTAASATFGRLDLAADFPVRMWKSADGAYVTDTLNVGEFVLGGGRIEPVLVNEDEGYSFMPGDKIAIGTVAKGAELPRVKGRGMLATRAIDGDDEKEEVYFAVSRGMQLIMR